MRTGAPPANCAAPDTGTLLCEIALPADWMAASAAGVKAKSGTWQGIGVAAGKLTPDAHALMEMEGLKWTSALVDTMKQISATFFPALFLVVSSSAHRKASSCQFVSAGIFTR